MKNQKGKKWAVMEFSSAKKGKMEAGENVWHCESWNTRGGFSFEI